MSELTTVDDNNFSQLVLQSKIPVLVDFWAPWCRPCQMVAPVLAELSGEYAGKITFSKLNVDQSPKIASGYGIMSIPTMLIFKGGKPVTNIIGFKPKDQLRRELDSVLG